MKGKAMYSSKMCCLIKTSFKCITAQSNSTVRLSSKQTSPPWCSNSNIAIYMVTGFSSFNKVNMCSRGRKYLGDGP
uniref:Uncharacterized protein n=1 Tax=Anguilla anguilla TaxID=7936 RepID=A0A0E9X5F3_ANGAN